MEDDRHVTTPATLVTTVTAVPPTLVTTVTAVPPTLVMSVAATPPALVTTDTTLLATLIMLLSTVNN